jgi:hypothetical protein
LKYYLKQRSSFNNYHYAGWNASRKAVAYLKNFVNGKVMHHVVCLKTHLSGGYWAM